MTEETQVSIQEVLKAASEKHDRIMANQDLADFKQAYLETFTLVVQVYNTSMAHIEQLNEKLEELEVSDE